MFLMDQAENYGIYHGDPFDDLILVLHGSLLPDIHCDTLDRHAIDHK